jgi:hypothetical protein
VVGSGSPLTATAYAGGALAQPLKFALIKIISSKAATVASIGVNRRRADFG